jgi:transcriptional regulator MraZ
VGQPGVILEEKWGPWEGLSSRSTSLQPLFSSTPVLFNPCLFNPFRPVEFSGSSPLKLDAKGRIFLPKRYTEFEDEKEPGLKRVITHFWLTLGLDGCLWLLDQNEWKRMQRRLKAMEVGDKKQRAVHRLFFGNAERLKPDSQGRITLPEKLRQRVGIEKAIELVGAGRRIEIWSSADYKVQVAEAEANWMDDLEAVLGGGGFE